MCFLIYNFNLKDLIRKLNCAMEVAVDQECIPARGFVGVIGPFQVALNLTWPFMEGDTFRTNSTITIRYNTEILL